MFSIVSHDGVFESEMCMGVTVQVFHAEAEKCRVPEREILRYAQDDKGKPICLFLPDVLMEQLVGVNGEV